MQKILADDHKHHMSLEKVN